MHHDKHWPILVYAKNVYFLYWCNHEPGTLARRVTVQNDRRGDDVVAMPRLQTAVVDDVVVTHALAASYSAAAAREASRQARRQRGPAASTSSGAPTSAACPDELPHRFCVRG